MRRDEETRNWTDEIRRHSTLPENPPALPFELPSRYEPIDVLGTGGMATVIRARDTILHREVAVKVMGGASIGGELHRRFVAEAQTTAQLAHPNILPIHDFGVLPAGRPFLVTPLVEGTTLKERLAELRADPIPIERNRILNVLIKVAEALAYAHDRGVVHRDVKPENILLGRFGETFLMDWGLAKLRSPSGEEPAAESVRVDAPAETREGRILGTLFYMSPEQVQGRRASVEVTTDLWAIGVVLYETLTGEKPFRREVARETARAIAELDPVPPSELDSGVPPELSAISMKCLRREPSLRYASAQDLAEDLRLYLEGRSVRAFSDSWARRSAKFVRRNRIVAATALVALAALFLVLVRLDLVGEDLRRANAERDDLVQAIERFDASSRRSANRDVEAEEEVRAAAQALAASAPGRSLPWRALGRWYHDRRYDATGAAPLGHEAVLDRAAAAFETAVAVQPDDDVSRGYLLWIALERDRLDDALEHARALERAVAPSELTALGCAARAWIEAARAPDAEVRRQALEKTVDAATESLRRDPDFAWAAQMRGAALQDLGRLEQAGQDLRRAVELEPRGARAHRRLAATMARLGRFEEALEHDRTAASLHPPIVEAHAGCASALLALGRLGEAAAAARRGLELAPEERELRRLSIQIDLARALARWTAGAGEEARALWRGAVSGLDELLREDPVDVDALVKRAGARLGLGRPEEALEDCDLLLALGADRPEVHLNRGVILLELGRAMEARDALSRTIELAPGSSRGHVLRGEARRACGDLAGAIADYARALDLDSGRIDALEGRGTCHLELATAHATAGRVAASRREASHALACFDDLLRLSSHAPSAFERRGRALFLLGEFARAASDLEVAIRLRPGPPPTELLAFLAEARRRARDD